MMITYVLLMISLSQSLGSRACKPSSHLHGYDTVDDAMMPNSTFSCLPRSDVCIALNDACFLMTTRDTHRFFRLELHVSKSDVMAEDQSCLELFGLEINTLPYVSKLAPLHCLGKWSRRFDDYRSEVIHALESNDDSKADMKREVERKELEKKRSPKVEFVSGGTQISVAGISAAVSSSLQSATVASDATKEPMQNKKLKWDKVDGDVKHPVLPSGNDKIVGHGVRASHLSAANADAGYNAFAQQKRREVE